jgi:hypothetical protein
MRSTRWTDEHDRLLAAAAPPVPPAGEAELDRVWGRVSGRLTDDAPRRRRRIPRLWIASVALIGAASLGTSGLAAANLFSAHTGQGPSDAEDLRLGGPGEKLDPAGPDFAEVIDEATTDIPFPTAASRAVALRHQVDDAQRHHPKPHREAVSTGSIRAWVADAAVCAWSNQWAAATRSGDKAARDSAISALRQAPSWPSVTDVDPHPYSRMETMRLRHPDGTVTKTRFPDVSQFYYLGQLATAMGGTDLGAVADLLIRHNGQCRADLLPDFTQADPMYPVS